MFFRNKAINTRKIEVINRIFIIILFALFIDNLTNLVDYIRFSLDSEWLLEPAENENLVFTNYLLNNSLLGINSLLKNGIMPIYPDFYHQLTSLFGENVLKNLRLISAMCLLMSYLIIFIWAFKITKLVLPALALPILVFGSGQHSLFFFIGKG